MVQVTSENFLGCAKAQKPENRVLMPKVGAECFWRGLKIFCPVQVTVGSTAFGDKGETVARWYGRT